MTNSFSYSVRLPYVVVYSDEKSLLLPSMFASTLLTCFLLTSMPYLATLWSILAVVPPADKEDA